MEIDGATALVTGGNRGIGEAFVEALIAAGARRVYVGTRDPQGADPLAVRYPGRAVPVTLDVTRDESVSAAAVGCADVDLLVNNAGVFRNALLIGADTIDGAREEMEVQYFGTLRMCRAFAPVLARNGGGAIVNVLSAAAIVSVPNMGGYSPSKFAARALTTSVRAELADQGTQVGCLIVGSVDTRMAEHVQGAKEKPADVARAGLEAIREGHREFETDDFARGIRSALERVPDKLEAQLAGMLKSAVVSTGR